MFSRIFNPTDSTITSEDAIACGQVKFDLMALLVPPKRDSANALGEIAGAPHPLGVQH